MQTLWCDRCHKNTHATAKCWGAGTIAIPPARWHGMPSTIATIEDARQAYEQGRSLGTLEELAASMYELPDAFTDSGRISFR